MKLFYAIARATIFAVLFYLLGQVSAAAQLYPDASVYKGSILRVSERVCADCLFYSELPAHKDGMGRYLDSLGRIDNNNLFLKVFDVADVVNVNEAGEKRIYLKLISQSDSLISYYLFHATNGMRFPFDIRKKTDGMKEMDICAFVEREVDKFTEEVRVHYASKRILVHPVKNIEKGVTTYYLRISASSNQPTAYVKGAILLMRNKQKINFPLAKVSTDLNDEKNLFGEDSYIHSVFVAVTKQQMEYLSKNEISDLRVYVFDRHLTASQSFEIKTVAQCFLEKK